MGNAKFKVSCGISLNVSEPYARGALVRGVILRGLAFVEKNNLQAAFLELEEKAKAKLGVWFDAGAYDTCLYSVYSYLVQKF